MSAEEEARPGTLHPTHADDEAIVMNGAPGLKRSARDEL